MAERENWLKESYWESFDIPPDLPTHYLMGHFIRRLNTNFEDKYDLLDPTQSQTTLEVRRSFYYFRICVHSFLIHIVLFFNLISPLCQRFHLLVSKFFQLLFEVSISKVFGDCSHQKIEILMEEARI